MKSERKTLKDVEAHFSERCLGRYLKFALTHLIDLCRKDVCFYLFSATIDEKCSNSKNADIFKRESHSRHTCILATVWGFFDGPLSSVYAGAPQSFRSLEGIQQVTIELTCRLLSILQQDTARPPGCSCSESRRAASRSAFLVVVVVAVARGSRSDCSMWSWSWSWSWSYPSNCRTNVL